MTKVARTWLAIVRDGAAAVPLEAAAGDNVLLLRPYARSFAVGPAFVGGLRLTPRLTAKHTVTLPPAHPLPLRSFAPALTIALGWTDARLDDLVGSCVALGARDAARIEAEMLVLARRFGPPAARPAHRRPRTPGRRALIAGQAAARGSQGRNP